MPESLSSLSAPSRRLAETIARARAAVQAQESPPLTFSISAPPAYTAKSAEPSLPVPKVVLRAAVSDETAALSSVMPIVPSLVFPPLSELTAELEVDKAAARVLQTLHQVACETAQARKYPLLPEVVVFHLPLSLLAKAVEYGERHLRRILPRLMACGLIDGGAHASKVNNMGLWDGYLWAVKLKPGTEAAKLKQADWKHNWRDFEGDIKAGRTVEALLAEMSELQAQEQKECLKEALKTWAVSPGRTKSPVADVDRTFSDHPVFTGLQDVIYQLGDLVNVHVSRRAEFVGRMGAALAHLLKDKHSRKWYCKLIWEAWRAELEARRGLQHLAAALARLETDLCEWKQLKNPGALLTARLYSLK